MFHSFVYRGACISHDLAVNTNCCLQYSIYHLGATFELIVVVLMWASHLVLLFMCRTPLAFLVLIKKYLFYADPLRGKYFMFM
jgi:hypothetical protein